MSLSPINAIQQKRIEEQRHLIATATPSTSVSLPPMYGRIVGTKTRPSSRGPILYVQIRFNDELNEITAASDSTKAFVLGHSIEEIALIWGDDLVGLEIKVEFTGVNKNHGIAYMTNTSPFVDLEKANTITPIGTILAPAGSGL